MKPPLALIFDILYMDSPSVFDENLDVEKHWQDISTFRVFPG